MNPEIAKLTPGQKLMKQAIHEIDDYFGEGVAFKNIEGICRPWLSLN